MLMFSYNCMILFVKFWLPSHDFVIFLSISTTVSSYIYSFSFIVALIHGCNYIWNDSRKTTATRWPSDCWCCQTGRSWMDKPPSGSRLGPSCGAAGWPAGWTFLCWRRDLVQRHFPRLTPPPPGALRWTCSTLPFSVHLRKWNRNAADLGFFFQHKTHKKREASSKWPFFNHNDQAKYTF